MDRWSSRDGKSQRGEEKKKEDQKRESLRQKKIQAREKVGKSRKNVFFHCLWLRGRQVGSLKRRVRSHLVGWKVKNCAPLWREADLKEKVVKTLRVRGTFGRCGVHAGVARSTFRSQNAKNTRRGIFASWDVEKTHAVVAKQMLKSKCEKNTTFGPILGVRVSFFMAGARWQAWGSYDLASLFCGGRNTLDRWSGKSQNAMVRGCHSAVNFYFLREVSQNWFVFDVVNFKQWGNLTELLQLWCRHRVFEEILRNLPLHWWICILWRSITELLRFRSVNFHLSWKSRRNPVCQWYRQIERRMN